MYRLLVDFNDIDPEDVVVGLGQSLTGPYPRKVLPGDRIRLHDDGEHEAWGDVTDVDDQNELIGVRIDRSTWGPYGHISVIQMIPGNRVAAWVDSPELLEYGWTQGTPTAWYEQQSILRDVS